MLITHGKTDCSPGDVGYDESRIDQIDRHFQRLMDEQKIMSVSYCLSRKGKIFACASIGEKSFREGDSTPLTPDSIFPIASITKTFTAVAIMKLVDDGLLRLDNRVGEFLPQLDTAPFTNIQVYHLLTHTSGIYPDSNAFDAKYHHNAWDLIEKKIRESGGKGEIDWIAAALANGLRREIGAEWQYCSFGYVLLGALIEKVSGLFAHEYIERNICRPLGLSDTAFDISPEMAKRCSCYHERYEKWLDAKINGLPDPEDDGTGHIWEQIPSTGGGLFSTVTDLNRYGNMLLNMGRLGDVRVLGRKAVERMATNALHNTPDYCWGHNYTDRRYGMGVDMLETFGETTAPGYYFHEGAGACRLTIDPAEEMVAAWCVPFKEDEWHAQALFDAQNVMWSGLI